MIDAFHFSPLPNEIWIPGWATDISTGFRALSIPKNASMLWFTLIGSGGGGGRPNVAAATAGGGGGGCGSVSHIYVPSSVIPTTLYVSVSLGGLGATANNTSGNTGVNSFISTAPAPGNSDEDVILIAGAGGGGSSAGAGGSAGVVFNPANGDMYSQGIFQSFVGQAGGAGTTTNGTAIGIVSSIFISPGAGGGGSSGGTGGAQTSASSLYPSISGGATGDNPGANGIMVNRPLICIGGTGGGGINGAGTGANRGGDGGGYGSGGGGGGNAASGVSGNGGNGAPGLLIMRWW